ncbi:MAG TPA: SpoIIE family protein phosphatase [Acidobacteriaceae bacterium]|nr:SpoIIE family protein phosphatase [Acidobacteriaceae bacterium]
MIDRIRGTALRVFLFCQLLAFLFLISARAETFRTQNPGTGSVAIAGPWQFHLGDDPAWAAPAFNDAGWEQIRGDDTWGAQQHPGYTGFAWYRKHIQVDGTSPSLALLMPAVDDTYELYWNGRRIGNYGRMPPHAGWWPVGHITIYSLGSSPASGVLAIRVWKAPLASNDPVTNGGLHEAPLLGDSTVFSNQLMRSRYLDEHHQIPRLMIAAVVTTAGLLAIVLFLRDRKQWLYLWLGLYLIADGLGSINLLDGFRYGVSFFTNQVYLQLVAAAADISLWLLLLTLFGFHKSRKWQRWTIALSIFYLLSDIIDMITLRGWEHAGLTSQWVDAITTAIYSVTPLFIFFIVGAGLLYKRQTAMLPIGIAAFLYGFWNALTNILGQGTRFTHWTIYQPIQNWALHLGSYSFGARFLLDTLLFLVLLYTVTLQQFMERRRQSQIELEVRSAREVQHVLIPEEAPSIPGLSIASVYKPAAELGGDFFQVIPLAASEGNPGALIVLGDVSGKGLKAAMTVSLIVGTVRAIADYTRQPAEILTRLNHRLMGRTERGFATCLVLRIHANGTVTLANAGHIAPFRDASELPVAGSLPLGIADDTTYDEIDFRLQEDETLTLYTDGILEARNAHGELFGFDRVADLMSRRPSVQQIVDTACAFGQEDDITVLSIKRLPAAETHTSTVRLTAQIATGWGQTASQELS